MSAVRQRLTPAELDFSRSRALVENKELAAIVCAPLEYVFDGRPRCEPEAHCTSKRPCLYHKLCREQFRFDELRVRFLTASSVTTVRALARALPRIYRVLQRAATGYRRADGSVRLFDQCPHGRPIQEWKDCERCAAEAAECDAL